MRRPTVYTARKLRREMSLPEVLLWQRLKGSPQGITFRKQHPIDPYVADFYCAAPKLVIEVDGEAHNRPDRPTRENERDGFLRQRGYDVLRVDAATILRNPGEAAASVIAYALNPLHHSPAAGGSPPHAGEDLILPARGEGDQPKAGGGGSVLEHTIKS